MALQNLLDAPVEPFDHAVGLRRFRWCQAVLDIQVSTELVELVFARRGPLAQAEQAIGERLAIARREKRRF